MRALWRNRDTASRAQQLQRMPLQTVGTLGEITRFFEKSVRPCESSLQSKLAPNRKAAKDLFLARRLRTPLQKEMSNSQASHSCKGKLLDRRSRPRRDEALPPGAYRK